MEFRPAQISAAGRRIRSRRETFCPAEHEPSDAHAQELLGALRFRPGVGRVGDRAGAVCAPINFAHELVHAQAATRSRFRTGARFERGDCRTGGTNPETQQSSRTTTPSTIALDCLATPADPDVVSEFL